MINFKKIQRDLYSGFVKHSPEILTGLGVAGMITATILAVSATPKAVSLLEEEKAKRKSKKMPVVDVVKTTWKCYVPSAAVTIASASCIIFADRQHTRRNAALATAYTLSEQAFKSYKDKVIESIGEKKEEEIRDKVAKDELLRNPVRNAEVIITGQGETLCFDPISCRYFKADLQQLRRIEAKLNKELYSSMYVSLNDFYSAIGLRPSQMGDDLGWNIDDGTIEFDFSAQLAEDDTPCLVINFFVKPRADYRHLM